MEVSMRLSGIHMLVILMVMMIGMYMTMVVFHLLVNVHVAMMLG